METPGTYGAFSLSPGVVGKTIAVLHYTGFQTLKEEIMRDVRDATSVSKTITDLTTLLPLNHHHRARFLALKGAIEMLQEYHELITEHRIVQQPRIDSGIYDLYDDGDTRKKYIDNEGDIWEFREGDWGFWDRDLYENDLNWIPFKRYDMSMCGPFEEYTE